MFLLYIVRNTFNSDVAALVCSHENSDNTCYTIAHKKEKGKIFSIYTFIVYQYVN